LPGPGVKEFFATLSVKADLTSVPILAPEFFPKIKMLVPLLYYQDDGVLAK